MTIFAWWLNVPTGMPLQSGTCLFLNHYSPSQELPPSIQRRPKLHKEVDPKNLSNGPSGKGEVTLQDLIS